MHSATHYTLLLTFLAGGALAQVLRPGLCPYEAAVSPFDVTKYLGKWYQIESFEQNGRTDFICVSFNYSTLGNNNFKWENTRIDPITMKVQRAELVAELTDSANEGTFFVGSPDSDARTPYKVLETDYENFAILWACQDLEYPGFDLYYELALIMTREPLPSSNVTEQARKVFEERNLEAELLFPTSQSDCPSES